MDRFDRGLKDPQSEKPMYMCDGCLGEIYPKEMVKVINHGEFITHDETDCILRCIATEWVSIEEALGLE